MERSIFLLSLMVPVLIFAASTSEAETQVDLVASPTPSAAVLVVEDFFEVFNERDLEALRSVYSDDVIVTFASLVSGAWPGSPVTPG